MQNIQAYMERSQTERQKHLKLKEPCSEIGGGSIQFRALLAYHVGTTIPNDRRIHLCHACGNGGCSNVRHLYWGTNSENALDMKLHGTFRSIRERTLEKYGEEGLREIAARAGRASGEAKRKPQEHWESYRTLFENTEQTRGWVARLSKQTLLSHTQIRRIAKRLGLV